MTAERNEWMISGLFHRKYTNLRMKLFALSLCFCTLLLMQLTASASASNIDFTTEYVVVSKSSSSSRSSTSSSRRIHYPQLSGAGGIESHHGDRMANRNEERPQHSLVALSSKSYISAPTVATTPTTPTASTLPSQLIITTTTATTFAPPLSPSKLLKRAGALTDLKHKVGKKSSKDIRNRTRENESRAKLHHGGGPDHVPDSSGHIPYRVSRPLLPPAEFGSGSSGGGPTGVGGYHPVAPYDSEKWHHEYWESDYKNIGYNSTRVQHIEAECQDDYMKIRIGFNGTFAGLVYSAGYAYDPDCMYINGSGRDYYEFYIQLNRCGTLGKNALHDEKRKNPTNFMWNTVTVQYNPLIEEEYDEHFKVTCEYGYDFWKTVTFPFLDVEVATGNPVVFTLSPPECYMEIQNGYGVGGPRVTGPVRVGDPLTLIIYMRSKYDGFDIVVNDCYAHNGANKRIQLIDEYGCPVDDKLISRFRGSWSDSGVFETQVYAYMKTFRFTGSPALYIECDVRMCHGRCPSQPCHWRNLKAVTKRDISSNSTAESLMRPPFANAPPETVTDKPSATQSENINLFQSLRVLQEGEPGADEGYLQARQLDGSGNQTCLKTTTFSALAVTFSLVMCILSAALMISCSRLKQRGKSSLYDTYITHKGQID